MLTFCRHCTRARQVQSHKRAAVCVCVCVGGGQLGTRLARDELGLTSGAGLGGGGSTEIWGTLGSGSVCERRWECTSWSWGRRWRWTPQGLGHSQATGHEEGKAECSPWSPRRALGTQAPCGSRNSCPGSPASRRDKGTQCLGAGQQRAGCTRGRGRGVPALKASSWAAGSPEHGSP